MNFWNKIRTVKDFPIEGIEFFDLTTLWKDKEYFKYSIDFMSEKIEKYEIDKIAAIESRGFIFAAPLAYKHSIGFVPIRKKGKLPAETISESYNLEYGEAILEIHKDSISKGEKILLMDDVLATGGTAKACHNMIKNIGGEISASLFFLELTFLEGRKKIDGDIISILSK